MRIRILYFDKFNLIFFLKSDSIIIICIIISIEKFGVLKIKGLIKVIGY